MSIRVIIVASDFNNTGLRKLGDSLVANDWDASVINVVWQGFGTKLLAVYHHLIHNPTTDRFIFCDAYDVVCLGTEEEFLMKLQINGWSDAEMICSAERGCWPDPTLADKYKKFEHGFNYLNSGLYYAKADFFMQLIENNTPKNSDDDQLYLTREFLISDKIILDNEQALFNSYSFIAPGEYTYENNRLIVNGERSIYVHGNGKQDMTEIYKLL